RRLFDNILTLGILLVVGLRLVEAFDERIIFLVRLEVAAADIDRDAVFLAPALAGLVPVEPGAIVADDAGAVDQQCVVVITDPAVAVGGWVEAVAAIVVDRDARRRPDA